MGRKLNWYKRPTHNRGIESSSLSRPTKKIMDHYPDLEQDIYDCDWLSKKIETNEQYAQHFYAALCNNEFQRNAVWPILREQTWSCTWRYAGGIVAHLRDNEDYIDWYCSGMGTKALTGFVGEGFVTDEVREDLLRLGWRVVDEE